MHGSGRRARAFCRSGRIDSLGCWRGRGSPRPTYATARGSGRWHRSLPAGLQGDPVTARGRCLRSPVPPPLSIGLCCRRSAPLDSFPSAPWAQRTRLRTGSWPGARRGSCCRLRGGGGNGGCGGGGASGRAWGGIRARPGSPSSESAGYLGLSRWTPQSPGRLTSARVYGMEAGPSGAGKGPWRGSGACCKDQLAPARRAWFPMAGRAPE